MMAAGPKIRVMIAGVGGASLGTELMKCLSLAGRYDVFGCDISASAFGLYEPAFAKTYLVDRSDYVASVIAACRDASAQWIAPGGEQPAILLAEAGAELRRADIALLANSPDIVRAFSNKAIAFERLTALGVPTPRTAAATSAAAIAGVGLPCIIKPSTGTGGSAMVFFAVDLDEAQIYADYIRRAGGEPIAQEYIGHEEGEFTVGVLSLPDGRVASSVALRRSLDSKLSVLSSARGGVVSSGYTQGYIADFPEIRAQAEKIALAIGSRGPINIQGRLRKGALIPFEINPRLSASAYLRALAGCNEIDWMLRHLALGEEVKVGAVREGWYLRSFTERFIAPASLKQ